jgi:bifunctional oligoribonuclease and PAP phosphatase NrnA
MLAEIARILKQEDCFAIVTHVHPDGDALGSLLGMYLALKEMGKTVWAVSSDSFPDQYRFLTGHEDILADAKLVERDIRWIVSLDVASKERISGADEALLNRVPVLNLDHHGTNPGFGTVNHVDPKATSTAELVYSVLAEMGYCPSRGVSVCLYTGLVTDTGCFRFSGVSSRTLHMAADILGPDLDAYEITRHIYEEYPVARLLLERIVLERMESRYDGKLLLSLLHHEDFRTLGVSLELAENLVNRLREIKGVEVAMLVTQVSDAVVRVNLRSKGLVDVAAIAKSLGGGGHRQAAGLRSESPLAEVKELVASLVGEALRRS